MKVLHVLGSIGPLRGGPSFVLQNLVTGLAERGISTHVVTTDDNGPERLKVPLGVPVIDRGVTYWYFPRQTRLYTSSLPLALWLWRNVKHYDLLHIHAVFTFASTLAAWIARAKGVPYIVRPLGILNAWGRRNRRPLIKKLSFWAVERGMLDHARLIHYTSERERIQAEQGGSRTTSIIIANPTDLEGSDRRHHAGKFRARHHVPDNLKLVVFLSRITSIKGLDLLIPAFARLNQRLPETRLVIAGDGEPEVVNGVKQLVKDAGLCDHVLWPGFLQGEDKAAILADADVFVLPSYSENFGVAVVEALCFQVPVIVSNQVGIHHEISQYEAGLVVPCAGEALADALIEMLSNPSLRSKFAANAGRLVRQQFSRGSILDALISTYQVVLGPSAA
jgi:glycosyltransferase involved in cell wall biosynthesis